MQKKSLSEREKQILGLAAAGLLDKNISEELNVSLNTLRTYWTRIRQKCGNAPRAALTAAYVQGELTSGNPEITLPNSKDLMIDTADSDTLRRAAIFYVTELRRTQEALRKAKRAYQVLGAYSDLDLDNSKLTTSAEAIEAICRILVDVGGYVMAWVGFAVDDEEHSVKIGASYGDIHHYLDVAKISWGDNSFGCGPTGLAFRTGETQINRDFLANPQMAPWREKALKRGFQSSIALPLSHREEVFGVLTAYASEPDAFDKEEAELLEQLARFLSSRLLTAGKNLAT